MPRPARPHEAPLDRESRAGTGTCQWKHEAAATIQPSRIRGHHHLDHASTTSNSTGMRATPVPLHGEQHISARHPLTVRQAGRGAGAATTRESLETEPPPFDGGQAPRASLSRFTPRDMVTNSAPARRGQCPESAAGGAVVRHGAACVGAARRRNAARDHPRHWPGP